MSSMQKRCFKRMRWRLPLVAALTAVAISATLSVPFAGNALASSGQPGEWNSYYPEHVGPHDLYSSNTVSEARDGLGNLLQVWRADDDTGAVWISYVGNTPIQFGSTQTNVAPTVVAYGYRQWMVLHVGVDNRIYYMFVTDSGSGVSWNGTWQWLPYQSTTTSVAGRFQDR